MSRSGREKAVLREAVRGLVVATKEGTRISRAHMGVLHEALSCSHKELFLSALRDRNGKVTDLNRHFTCATSCNSAIYNVSPGKSAQTMSFYITNYILEDPATPASVLSICASVLKAHDRAKKHASVAADAGTAQRSSMHELSKMVLTGRGVVHEYAATSMALANLGGEAEPMTHGQNHLNVNNALALVKKAQGGACFGSRDFGDHGIVLTAEGSEAGPRDMEVEAGGAGGGPAAATPAARAVPDASATSDAAGHSAAYFAAQFDHNCNLRSTAHINTCRCGFRGRRQRLQRNRRRWG